MKTALVTLVIILFGSAGSFSSQAFTLAPGQLHPQRQPRQQHDHRSRHKRIPPPARFALISDNDESSKQQSTIVATDSDRIDKATPDNRGDTTLLERFKNRAVLLQHVVQEQLSQLKLTQNKLAILQNVTQQLSTQKMNVTKQLEDERDQRILIQKELNRTKEQLLIERSSRKIEMGQLEIDRDAALEQVKDANKRIKALQTELLNMDQHLEETNAKLLRAEKASKREKQDFELRERTLQQRITRLQQELAVLHQEREKDEQVSQEKVQIAVASVQAADKREKFLRQELEAMRSKCVQLEEEKIAILSRSESPDKARDAEQGHVKQKVKAMQQEIDRLNDQIRSMRLTHSAELSSWKRKANDNAQPKPESHQELADLPQTEPRKRSWWARIAKRIRRQ